MQKSSPHDFYKTKATKEASQEAKLTPLILLSFIINM